jgi:hypothetical protein
MPVPFRPAVFACQLPQRYDREPKKILSSPPYPAWPEIADSSTFYTLPTLCSYSAISGALYWPGNPHWDSEEEITLAERINEMGEEAEAQGPHIAEILTGSRKTVREKVMGNRSLGIAVLRGLSRSIARGGHASDKWNAFAYLHDIGHVSAFSLVRYTTLGLNTLTSEVFKLLRPTSVVQRTNFWDKFQARNDALVEYIDRALELEELRANFIAFALLEPDIRASIEADLREVMEEEGTLELFDILAEVTNENWDMAWYLSICAEIVDPMDPLQGLQWIFGANTEARVEIDQRFTNVVLTSIEKQKSCWEVHFHGSRNGRMRIVVDIGERKYIEHWRLPTRIQELIFLESLRQQLVQWSGLACPFKQRRRTCCGFGHYLSAVWEHLPTEYQYPKFVLHPKTAEKLFFRKPSKVCLNYGLG